MWWGDTDYWELNEAAYWEAQILMRQEEYWDD